jgi:F-type H+-transporting ATPase subunit b
MPPVEPGHGAPEHGHGAALPGHGHGPHAGHPEHPGHPGHPGHEGRAGHAPGAAEHGERASGAKHGRDENAPPGEINWFYGFLGTSKDKEPSLLWRKPEMAPPFAANLVNFALFAYILVRLGKKPLQEALAKRKETILRDMEAAQKMKQDAEKRLGVYEDKLRHIQDEVERIRKDFREQGERDRERILREAQEKRDRMLRDARFMIEQESKQLRLELMRETVDAATAAAETILRDKVSAADQARLAEAYLGELAASRGLAPTKGGSA